MICIPTAQHGVCCMSVMLDCLSAYIPIRYGESSCNNDDDGTLSLSPYPSILAKFNYYNMVPKDVTSHPPSAWGLGWKDLDGTTWTPRCLPSLGGNSVWASAVPGVRFR
jgi:hypothetical protein